MSVDVKQNWVTIDTENPDHWVPQSYTFKRELIVTITLCKRVANTGCDNGVEVCLTHKDVMQNRIWMRYKDFEKAEADYKTLIQEL